MAVRKAAKDGQAPRHTTLLRQARNPQSTQPKSTLSPKNQATKTNTHQGNARNSASEAASIVGFLRFSTPKGELGVGP